MRKSAASRAPPRPPLCYKRGIEPELVLDEGGGMVDGQELSLSGRVATIGIAEKGFVSLELSVESEGGE